MHIIKCAYLLMVESKDKCLHHGRNSTFSLGGSWLCFI